MLGVTKVCGTCSHLSQPFVLGPGGSKNKNPGLLKKQRTSPKGHEEEKWLPLPKLGFGTFIGVENNRIDDLAQRKKVVIDAVDCALRTGYRCLDVACAYNNQRTVAEGIKKGMQEASISRSQLYMIGKGNSARDVKRTITELFSCAEEEIGKDGNYLDLFLWHHPEADLSMLSRPGAINCSAAGVWKSLDACKKKGWVRNIGVSNVYLHGLRHLMQFAKSHHLAVPYANEVEIHLWNQEPDLVLMCHIYNVKVIAYCPLGYNLAEILLETGEVKDMVSVISKEKKVSAAEILLAYTMQRGITVIPSSRNKDHIQSNFNSHTISLSKQQMGRLAALNTNNTATSTAQRYREKDKAYKHPA